MYFFADKLLRRFKARGLFIMALCVYILRLLLYTFIASPGLILGLQLLHGFTSPAIWAAGISYVGETAPKGLETTSQGIFTGVLNGLGSAAGAYIGGVVFQVYGVVAMFQMFAGILFVALLLFVFVEKRIPANVEQCEAQTAM
jgi:PPP family 3-phenylpropionic acid transporter